MRRLVCVGLALLFLAGPARGGEIEDAMQRIGAWFKVGEDALADWSVSVPDPADAMRVAIRRKTAMPGPLRRVMAIYPRKSSAYDVAMTTVLADFASRAMNVEFLAANFANDPAQGARLVEQARREGYDLIFAMGSETVAWLHARHRDIATPVVTLCAKDPVQLGQIAGYERGSGTSFAFTSLNVMLDVQLAYLLELKPRLRNLAILVDATNDSAVETQSRPVAEAARGRGIEAFEVSVDGPARAGEQLAQRLPAAVERMRQRDPSLENSVFWITGSTAVFTEIATINAHAGRVPVLAVVPEVVQPGDDSAVLSIGVSFESNAQLAAVYGAEILTGRRRAGDMKVGVVSPPDIAVNFKRAREIGLKIPFSFLEAASFVYDAAGKPARLRGQAVAAVAPKER